MQRFRFTANMSVSDAGIDLKHFTDLILTKLLEREASGELSDATVRAWFNEHRVQIQFEFPCDGFNKAHIAGLDKIEKVITDAGGVLTYSPPVKAVTGEYAGKDFDTKLEQVLEQVSFQDARTELVLT